MKKHEVMTWKQFHLCQFPKSSQNNVDTFHILKALRENFKPDVLGGFAKWGVEVLKDLSAFTIFNDYQVLTGSPDIEAMKAASMIMKNTNWKSVELLFQEGLIEYKKHVENKGEKEFLASAIKELEYTLPRVINGVEKPGDFYRMVMGPGESMANTVFLN